MPNATEVTKLLQRGIAAAKARRTEEARQALILVTELDDRNEQAWLWLSGVVESLEDRRVCLENVLAINPDNRHAQSGLDWLDQQVPPAEEERCPRCNGPIPLSGTTCPDCEQILIVACPACGQYVDVKHTSCPECGQSLGDFRDGARYHLALAQAYLEQHRGALAQEAAARAAAEAADVPQVLQGVALLYEQMGYTDLAIATYKQAIECDPENGSPYAHLGAIYRRRAMLTESREMYERATRLADDDPAVLFGLACAYIDESGAADKALTLLKRATDLDPEHAQAHLLLGDVYLDRGQRSQAIQHYEQACELATPDSGTGREARRKLTRWRPPVAEHQIQGWGETLRRVAGLMLIPALAALVNAGLIPWKINPAAWIALMMASAGAYLWVCATDVRRNPAMRVAFGPVGVEGFWRQALVGIPGAVLWSTALGLILWKV